MSARALAGADRARRRAAVAATPGLRALERVEALLEPGGLLRLRLSFVPDAGGAPGAPEGVRPSSVRLRGPGGAVAVVAVTAPEGDGSWLDARAVAPAGAGAGAYTLQLVGVPGVDPLFSSATFRVGGGAAGGGEPDEDGAPVEAAPPPAASIDYLAKDYTTFRALMLDRMAVTLPAWTERSPADIGVMLVEVLAYAADYLSYYQDAAATEAYLGTARLRTSLARHARLLDYRVNQGCSAVAWVQVRVGEAGLSLPPGTRFYTRTAQDAACLVPGTAQWAGAMREQPLAFETMDALLPDPNLNEIPLYTWGMEAYALERGATTATLQDAYVAGTRALATLRPGDVLVLQEQRAAGGGAPDPAHRQAVRLAWLEPRMDAAPGATSPVPVVDVGWHDGDALAFRLVVAGTDRGAPYTGGAVALGNLVLADHGETSEWIGLPPVPPAGPYRPWVPKPNVARRPPFHARRARAAAAADATVRDPARALPEVWLEDGDGRRWRVRADLLGSSPYSRDFVVEADEEGASRLRFGDGQLGMAPPPGTRFRLRCRSGLDLLGNVGRDVLAHLQAPANDVLAARRMESAVLQVRNPLPATGGAAPEPGYQVRTRAPQAFHQQARGATPDDWVALAEAQPQVLRAAAEPGWEGTGPQDRVWVQRRQLPEDGAFLSMVAAALEPYRPAGRGLRVLPPCYVGIDVTLTVRLDDQALCSAVRQALRQALLGPGGVFAPERYGFGQAVWRSRVVAAAAAVAGVVWVQATRFARWSPYGDSGRVPEALPMARHEVAVLRDDAAAPWNGTLALELNGGIG